MKGTALFRKMPDGYAGIQGVERDTHTHMPVAHCGFLQDFHLLDGIITRLLRKYRHQPEKNCIGMQQVS
jgi:hypothetical protein